MIVFLVWVKSFLKLIGIDVNSFAVAGSLLFYSSIRNDFRIRIYRDEEASSASAERAHENVTKTLTTFSC
jgi:multiple antibiotic resistance protein